MKFVHESDVEKKGAYTGILRAQLSSYELLLMFYGTVHPKGEKLYPLLHDYAMLKNLDKHLLFNRVDEVKLYNESAYGRDKESEGDDGQSENVILGLLRRFGRRQRRA